jgi:hypothetical protein
MGLLTLSMELASAEVRILIQRATTPSKRAFVILIKSLYMHKILFYLFAFLSA